MIEPRESSISEAVFTFIWSFKKGDNIDYNFLVLDQLYGARRACGTQEGKSLFNKPIIVTIVAIVECILADFIDRIKQHRHEPIANLSPAQIHGIRYKAKGGHLVERQIKELTHFIDQVAKHDLFDAKSGPFYAELHYFRKVRNRIHIQNAIDRDLPADESKVFSDDKLEMAQRLLEGVLVKMVRKFPRPSRAAGAAPIDLGALRFPWR